MPTVFDVTKSMTCDNITFPVMECKLSGGGKKHEHEFAYQPGGATELLGRKSYRISVKSIFCDSFPAYGPSLYPTALNELRRRFEAQMRFSLDVPNLGVIRAYAETWDFTLSGKYQNGEDVTIVFCEDTTDLFSVETLLRTQSSGFNQATEEYSLALDDIESPDDILESIREAANQVQAIVDTVELFDAFIAAKIAGLTDLIDRASENVALLKDPKNLTFIESLKSLWQAGAELGETIVGVASLAKFEVPVAGTLSEICIQIYGSTERAQELLSLNTIADPFLIPAGTVLVYSP